MRIASIFLFVVLFATACNPDLKTKSTDDFKQIVTGNAQGTTYRIVYYDLQRRDLKPAIDSILGAIDQSVSTYVEGSTIDRWNKSETGGPIDELFYELLIRSWESYQASNGAFDPTVKPLVSYWGFGPERFEHPEEVDDNEIQSMLSLVNFDTLELVADFQKVPMASVKTLKPNEHPRQLIKPLAGMQLDFNAIGQGWSVDKIVAYMQGLNIKYFFVELGGEIVAGDPKPDGSLWRFGIDKPIDGNEERSLQAIINLRNKGLATSGNYRKFYERDGVRYAHTIDPTTGYPVEHQLLSTTVVASNATKADAMATAFMVMGHDSALAFIEERPYLGTYVYLISADSNGYRTHTSTQIEAMLEVQGQ